MTSGAGVAQGTVRQSFRPGESSHPIHYLAASTFGAAAGALLSHRLHARRGKRASGDVSKIAPSLDTPDQAKKHFELATEHLTASIKRNRRVALAAGIVGVVAVVAASIAGYKATTAGAEALKDSNYDVSMLAFELVRTAGAAALLAAFVWGLLNLARAALDQSTRYEKRFVAGHFLVYVLDMFETEIKHGNIEVTDMMLVFKSWNDSVDSAYTNVKFGSKHTQGFSISTTKDGSTVSAGGPAPQPPSK